MSTPLRRGLSASSPQPPETQGGAQNLRPSLSVVLEDASLQCKTHSSSSDAGSQRESHRRKQAICCPRHSPWSLNRANVRLLSSDTPSCPRPRLARRSPGNTWQGAHPAPPRFGRLGFEVLRACLARAERGGRGSIPDNHGSQLSSSRYSSGSAGHMSLGSSFDSFCRLCSATSLSRREPNGSLSFGIVPTRTESIFRI